MDWQDEVPWINDRIFEAYITEEKIDKHGDKILIDGMADAMPWFMKNGVIHYKHTALNIGKPLAWKREGTKIAIRAGIYKEFPIHDQIWKEIKEYETAGATSIGGIALNKRFICDGAICSNDIDEVGLWEVSWVGNKPANDGAMVTDVAMAKAWEEPERLRDKIAQEMYSKLFNDLSDEEKQKVHNVAIAKTEILQKPFAGFKDFDDCMKEMQDKYDEATAKKVCGKLKSQYEKGDLEVYLIDEFVKHIREDAMTEDEIKNQEEAPDETEAVTLDDVVAMIQGIVTRLDALESEQETPEEEEIIEDSDKPVEKDEAIPQLSSADLEKAVENVLQKHKITVLPTDVPAQAETATTPTTSFEDMLQKAREANNLEEFRS